MAAISVARIPPLHKPSSTACSQRGVAGCRRTCVVVRADHFRLSSSAGAQHPYQHASIRAFDPTTSYAATQPPATVSQQGGFALPLVASGVALIGVAAILYKKLTGHGSLNGLEARGYMGNRGRGDVLFQDMMKDVNTVRIETLSSSQIDAARARRSRERANHRVSMEEVELPPNHPWATRAPVSNEDHEASLQHLKLRSTRRRMEDFEAPQQAQGGRAPPRSGRTGGSGGAAR